MLARCARCQGTFTTDHYGRQRCPHCGSDLVLADPNAPQPTVPAGREESAPPEGGAPLGAPPPPSGGWAPLPPPPPAPGEVPSPFAERVRRGFFASFFETWKLASVEPQAFFARVRIDQLGSAVLFGVLASWVGSAVAALFGWLGGAAWMGAVRQAMQGIPGERSQIFERLALAMGGGATLIRVVLAPIFAVVFIFVGAGILHLFLLLFRGGARGFHATLTVMAYSSGVYLLSAVPVCGGVVAPIWQAVILVIGLAAVHRCSMGKSAGAVLLPLLLCVCCACLAGFALAGAIATALGHLQGGVSNL